MKKLSLLILVVTMAFFSAPAHANLITNGGFENGLVGWTTSGDVTLTDDGQAALGASNTYGKSTLSQEFYIAPNTTTLKVSFDFTISGKDWNPFATDWAKVKLLTLTTYSFSILEWEAWDVTDIESWSSKDGYFAQKHFETSITLGNYNDKDPNANIMFTLSESVFGPFDKLLYTTMTIDNVVIANGDIPPIGNAPIDPPAPVPEPATLFLLGAGLIGMVAVSRKKQFKK